MSSSEVPVTESPTWLENVGQEMIPTVGTNAKRRPLTMRSPLYETETMREFRKG